MHLGPVTKTIHRVRNRLKEVNQHGREEEGCEEASCQEEGRQEEVTTSSDVF
jgi:hypothetical protein